MTAEHTKLAISQLPRGNGEKAFEQAAQKT